MIRHYKETAGALPPLVSDGFCDSEDIISLIQALHNMVASIMTCNATEEEIGIVEYEIKMFLSLVDVIDKSMNTNKGNSKTRRKRNGFQCTTLFAFSIFHVSFEKMVQYVTYGKAPIKAKDSFESSNLNYPVV